MKQLSSGGRGRWATAAVAVVLVLLFLVDVASSQTFGQQQQRRACSPRCQCSQAYIPFCGTDGVTYSNKCQLECAQEFCDRSLGVKFEGVCPVPYVHKEGQNFVRTTPRYIYTLPTVPVRNTPLPWYAETETQPARWITTGPRRDYYVLPIVPGAQGQRQQPPQRGSWQGK